MKLIILIITCLLGSLTPAISQNPEKASKNPPIAWNNQPIWLKNETAEKYLGKSRDYYATIDKEPWGYVFTSGNNDRGPLLNGHDYSITSDDMFLYETGVGNAGFQSKGGSSSAWTIKKQKMQSSSLDDTIRHGDVILLLNVWYPHNYLYDFGTWTAAVGDYPQKQKEREWTVEWTLPKLVSKLMDNSLEIIYQTIYDDNRGGPASPGATITLTLSSTDEASLSQINNTNWQASVTATTTVGQDAGGLGPSSSLSLSATAAFGGAREVEKKRVQTLMQGKSITTTYDRPKDCEVLSVTRLSVPYRNFELSYEGVAPVKMRAIDDAINITSLQNIFLPTLDSNGKIVLVDEDDVNDALEHLKKTDPVSAMKIRDHRLPIWKENGWVGNANLAREVSNAVKKYQPSMTPGQELMENEKLMSANNSFQLRVTRDGNFIIEELPSSFNSLKEIYRFPLPNSGGKIPTISYLRYGTDGNVCVVSDQGKYYCATNGNDATANILNKSVKLVLTDDGRLILVNSNEQEIWATPRR